MILGSSRVWELWVPLTQIPKAEVCSPILPLVDLPAAAGSGRHLVPLSMAVEPYKTILVVQYY